MSPIVAVILPCYNEELTVTQVVREIQAVDSSYRICVFDNNSTDRSALFAKEAGAEVFLALRQGKGEVIRQAFSDIEADIYVIIDADSECDASALPKAVQKLVEEGLDMLTLVRVSDRKDAYRPGHAIGNKLITSFTSLFFGKYCTDVLSGYRIFSRRYVKVFSAHSIGFEIEVELSIFALQMRLPIAEMDTVYKSRPDGSVSKLNTFRDGFRILYMIILLIFAEKPFLFFSVFSLLFAGISLFLGWGLYLEFLGTSKVARFPTAFLAVGLMISALLFFTTGLIIHVLQRNNNERRREAYNRCKRYS